MNKELNDGKIISLEDRIPKLKQQRRKKANRRLAFLLILFFLLIACIVYFQSPLSHVKYIKVTGNQIYSEEEIISNCGINNDTIIWNIDKKRAQSSISKLPEVKFANIIIKLPNTVLIEIEEWEKMAYIMDKGQFIPVLENGKRLDEEKTKKVDENVPVLIDFKNDEIIHELIEQLGSIDEKVRNSISEIHYSPKKRDKYHITLYMNDGYEVSATIKTLAKNLSYYPAIVNQLDPKIKGVIDIEVGTFFKAYENKQNEGEQKNEKR